MPGDAAEDAHLALMSGRGGDARHALAGVSGGGAGLLYAPPPFACGSRAFPGLAGEELERGGGGSHAGSYREASSARRGERERRERGSGGDSASPERVVMRRSPLASARYAPYYAPAMLRSWPRYDEGDETFAYNEESERRRGRGEYATAREEDVGATVYGRRGVSSSGCRASASSASCLPMVLPPPSFGGGVPLGEYAYPGGVEACRYGSPGGRRGERWARDEHGGRGEEAARAAAYLADREAEDEDRRDGRGRKPSGEGLYAGGGVWAPRQRVYGGRDERDVGDVYAAAAGDRYLRGDEDRERREAYYYESRSGRGHAGDAQAGGRRRDGAGGAGGERHRQAAGGEDVKRRHDEEEGRRRDEAGTRRKDESDRRRRRDIDEREFFMAAAAQAGGAGGGGGDRVAAGRRLYEAEEEAEFPRGHKPYRHYRDGEEDRLRAQGGGAERREDEERAAKRRAALLAEEEHSAPRAGRRGGGPLSSYGGAAEGASDAGDQESGERRRDADSCHHHHGYDAAESEESYALLARDPQAARAHRGRATLERDVHAVDAGGHGRRRHEDRDFYPGGGERIRDKERGEDAYMSQLASRERLVRRGRGGGDDGRAMDAPPPAGGYGGPEDACRAGGGVEDDAPRRRRKSRSRSPGGAGYFVGYGGYAASRSHFPAQTAQHPHSHAEGARRRGCGGDGDEEVVAGGNEARDDLSRRTEEDRYRANAAAGRRRPEYASRAPGEEDRPRREEAGAAFGGEQRHRGYRTAREEHA
ncbi:hypothetical protein BESB_023480 [Besnoitia besnoiti]|uniref:Uncharacterized protein n=1 Tax=Besnoitia besnoiti TaxID=94643 RepID=A0A2A9M7I5_BESBE|nr:hypothetical protein BESB_023480 [Besnoitia besnoiti]PFH31856.1 hypothetical protein BESB_023480 [Besnoitia besnoiti]